MNYWKKATDSILIAVNLKIKEIFIMVNLANGDVSSYIQALVSETIEDLQMSVNKDRPSEKSCGMEESQETESSPPNRTDKSAYELSR